MIDEKQAFQTGQQLGRWLRKATENFCVDHKQFFNDCFDLCLSGRVWRKLLRGMVWELELDSKYELRAYIKERSSVATHKAIIVGLPRHS